MVDMDHQSSLSILFLNPASWEESINKGQAISEIFTKFTGQSDIFPGSGLIIKRPFGYQYGGLDLVPASLQLDNIEIDLTSSQQGSAIQSEWNKRTLVCRWIEENKIDDMYDYIIFDCPPATKIVCQNAIAASYGYIIPVVPEAVMERGAPHLKETCKSIDTLLTGLSRAQGVRPRMIYVPDTRLIGLVITRIRTAPNAHSGYTNEHTQHLNSLKHQWKNLLVEPYIEDGTGVQEALTRGVPVYDTLISYSQNVGGRGFPEQFQELTKSLKERVDDL